MAPPPFRAKSCQKRGLLGLFVPIEGSFSLNSSPWARIFDQRPPRNNRKLRLFIGGRWSKIRAHGEVVRRDAQMADFPPLQARGARPAQDRFFGEKPQKTVLAGMAPPPFRAKSCQKRGLLGLFVPIEGSFSLNSSPWARIFDQRPPRGIFGRSPKNSTRRPLVKNSCPRRSC